MAHHFGLSCICWNETILAQCRHLFRARDDRVYEAIKTLVVGCLGEGRHWCDVFIYEVVLSPLVDIIDSRERCIEKITDFIQAVRVAVAKGIPDLEIGKLVSILSFFFLNSANFRSNDDE